MCRRRCTSGFLSLGAALSFAISLPPTHTSPVRRQSADLGFKEESPGGAWTWHFEQPLLRDPIGHLDGPAVRFAAALGIPYIRLALAVPSELIPGNPGTGF